MAVGAPGAEAVYLYRRNTMLTDEGEVNGTWGNGPVEMLMSSDFDYDVVHLTKIVHRQVCNMSVSREIICVFGCTYAGAHVYSAVTIAAE